MDYGGQMLVCLTDIASDVCHSQNSVDEDDDIVESNPKAKQGSSKRPGLSRGLSTSLAHANGTAASGDFLTAVIRLMWNNMNIAVGNAIKDALDPQLRELKPVPLHFIKLDLGNVPIRTDNMFIHGVEGDGTSDGEGGEAKGIQIDVDVVWDGKCDIMLQANVSRGVKMTFGVKHFKLAGRLHVLLGPMTTELPVISAAQFGFINPPEIELSFTGAVQSLNRLSFIQSALLRVIQSSLAGLLVLPNRMVNAIDPASYDFFETCRPPVGMVRITAISGRGFKVQRGFINDIPDVYCLISLGASKYTDNQFRTSTVDNDLAPRWNESCDFILYDMDQKVYVEAFDEDPDTDDALGNAEVTVRELFKADGWKDLELKLKGKRTGCHITISADLFFLSERLRSFTSPRYGGKDQLCGLATIFVTRAFDIPLAREDADTCVKVVYGEGSRHERKFFTATVVDAPGYDALNPIYDSVFYVPLSARMLRPGSVKSPNKSFRGLGDMLRSGSGNAPNDIVFTLTDGASANGTKSHGDLGRLVVSHESLLRARGHTITETLAIGDGGAMLEFRIILSGMQSEEEKSKQIVKRQEGHSDLPPSPESAEDCDPVSVRITAMRGRGFRTRKRRIRRDDVPDVYCDIHLIAPCNEGRQPLPSSGWRTPTSKDDTMPNWNESRDFDFVVPSRDVLHVDVYDENRTSKDVHIGTAEFSVEMLLRKRVLEAELRDGSAPTDSYVTFKCVMLSSDGTAHTDDDQRESAPTDEGCMEDEFDRDAPPSPPLSPSVSSSSSRLSRVKKKLSPNLRHKKKKNLVY